MMASKVGPRTVSLHRKGMYARIEVAEDRDAIGDADLLRYFRRGDQSALDVLMERHRDALFRFCYHLTGNREDAEDVCQETLARAMTRVRTLQSDSAFRSWLFSIARNLSIDTHRRKKRTTAMPDDEAMPIQLFTETPQDRVEVAEEHQTVVEAMGKLAHSHQRVLVLREVEGMSYAAIAEQLDVSQSAVETLLFRARRRLKEEYHKSAAPALALIAGLRELILKAAGPVAGGTMAKLAMTAAMVGSVALTLPQSYHFPQVPSSTGSRLHTGSTPAHGSAGSRPHGSTTSRSTGAVVPPTAFKPATGVGSTIASSLVFHAPTYYASSTTSSTSRHAGTRKATSRSHNLQKHIPGPPSTSNTTSGRSQIAPPSIGVLPVKAVAPAPVAPAAPAPTADTHVKWVPAAVQRTGVPTAAPAPTAQPTTVPAPPPTAAPVPTSAPVQAPAPGNSGNHGHAGKVVPAGSAPVVEQPEAVSQNPSESGTVQPYVAPAPGTTTGQDTASGNVPPGQAKKAGAGWNTQPGHGPHK
jgi:RNA polymerase sigma-70 factor, ECF subfamily